MLSLSAPFIPQFFKEQLDSVFPYTDYVLGNEEEALSFAKSHGWEISDVQEIAKKMATLSKKNTNRHRTVIITQGTDPTISAVADADGNVQVKLTPVHAISKHEINDTNGAG